MAYRADAARVLQRRHSTGGSENGQTGSRGGEYLIEPTFSIKKIGRRSDTKKGTLYRITSGTDAMPSHMSEGSDLAEPRCRRLANANNGPGHCANSAGDGHRVRAAQH